jgi:fructose-bisphosphate aldolase, class I
MTLPGIAEFISGVIIQDETIRQKGAMGTPLAEVLAHQGFMPGIKVDTGAKPLASLPGENITEGLDGLRDRLKEYCQMGAHFASRTGTSAHTALRSPPRSGRSGCCST